MFVFTAHHIKTYFVRAIVPLTLNRHIQKFWINPELSTLRYQLLSVRLLPSHYLDAMNSHIFQALRRIMNDVVNSTQLT